MKKSIILGLLILSVSSFPQASQSKKGFVKLNSHNTTTNAYLSTGKLNHRLGNAVWARLLLEFSPDSSPAFKTAFSVLIGCDGTWVSDSFASSISFSEDFLEAYAKLDATEIEQPSDVVGFYGGGLLNDELAGLLKPRAKELCTTARKEEPKGKLVGLSKATKDDGSGTLGSLVVGSTKKEPNGLIKAWVRRNPFVIGNSTYPDGTEVLVEGEPVLIEKFENQVYGLQQLVYDCKRESSDLLQYIEYRSDGSVKSSAVNNNPQLKEVVPGSVGEQELDWICKVYSKG